MFFLTEMFVSVLFDSATSPRQAGSPLIQLFLELASEYLIKQMHKEIGDSTWLSDFTPFFEIGHFVTILIGIIIVKKKNLLLI